MARDPLITHVTPELALAVKKAAEDAGVTASAYIGKVLTEHVEGQSTPSIVMYARDGASVIAAQDIRPDDVVVLDPVIGMERVMAFEKSTSWGSSSSFNLVKVQLERHLPRTGKKISRFAFRGHSEPVIVVKV